jgi:hypothetical protein
MNKNHLVKLNINHEYERNENQECHLYEIKVIHLMKYILILGNERESLVQTECEYYVWNKY